MTEKSCRETEMSRVEFVGAGDVVEKHRAQLRLEMSEGIKFLGSGGQNRKDESKIAARLTKLTHSMVERLRYKKIQGPEGAIVEIVREAVRVKKADDVKREEHKRFVESQSRGAAAGARLGSEEIAYRLATVEERLARIDPEFHGEAIGRLRFARDVLGRASDRGNDRQ